MIMVLEAFVQTYPGGLLHGDTLYSRLGGQLRSIDQELVGHRSLVTLASFFTSVRLITMIERAESSKEKLHHLACRPRRSKLAPTSPRVNAMKFQSRPPQQARRETTTPLLRRPSSSSSLELLHIPVRPDKLAVQELGLLAGSPDHKRSREIDCEQQSQH